MSHIGRSTSTQGLLQPLRDDRAADAGRR
jgi:hypothetical protein